jgi:hypothetical protein
LPWREVREKKRIIALALFPPLIYRFASVIDTERALLGAVRYNRRKQIGHLHVPAVLPLEALQVVLLAPPAWFTDHGGSPIVGSAYDGLVRGLGHNNSDHP